jgi:hypothetical protein
MAFIPSPPLAQSPGVSNPPPPPEGPHFFLHHLSYGVRKIGGCPMPRGWRDHTFLHRGGHWTRGEGYTPMTPVTAAELLCIIQNRSSLWYAIDKKGGNSRTAVGHSFIIFRFVCLFFFACLFVFLSRHQMLGHSHKNPRRGQQAAAFRRALGARLGLTFGRQGHSRLF